MSNESKQPTQKAGIDKSSKPGEFKTKVFTKSDWPKTSKETIKLVMNVVFNFIG